MENCARNRSLAPLLAPDCVHGKLCRRQGASAFRTEACCAALRVYFVPFWECDFFLMKEKEHAFRRNLFLQFFEHTHFGASYVCNLLGCGRLRPFSLACVLSCLPAFLLACFLPFLLARLRVCLHASFRAWRIKLK